MNLKTPFTFDEQMNQVWQGGKTIVLSWGKSATSEHKRLITAAPELLEALETCLNNPDKISDWASAWSLAQKWPVTDEVKAKADKYQKILLVLEKATDGKIV